MAVNGLGWDGEEGNALTIKEMRHYLHVAASQKRVLLSDVVDRFSAIPWGWMLEGLTVLVARLLMACMDLQEGPSAGESALPSPRLSA